MSNKTTNQRRLTIMRLLLLIGTIIIVACSPSASASTSGESSGNCGEYCPTIKGDAPQGLSTITAEMLISPVYSGV